MYYSCNEAVELIASEKHGGEKAGVSSSNITDKV